MNGPKSLAAVVDPRALVSSPAADRGTVEMDLHDWTREHMGL